MCLGGPKIPPPPPPPPPAPPPPVKTAAVVQPASKRGANTYTKKRRGTAQLTVKRPVNQWLGKGVRGGINLNS